MNNGGVENLIMSYYRHLADRCEFSFVCFDDSTSIPKEEIEALGGKIFIVPYLKHLHQFNKALDKILKENHFDIIHSNINTLSVFPLRIAKKNKHPIRIAHSHSVSNKKEWKKHLAKSILRLFSKTYANIYFSCSEVAGRYQFGNKAYNKGQVTIIKNGIELSNFKYDPKVGLEIRKEQNIPQNATIVGTVGRFDNAKNQMFMLELAKDNKDVFFFIVGDGELKEKLSENVKENKLENVRIINPSRPIKDYYSSFDIFMLPSLYEGLGLTAIEAEANGLYVLLSDNVPEETLVSKYGARLSLDVKANWNQEINTKHERIDNLPALKEAGYDIKEASETLYNLYLKLLDK